MNLNESWMHYQIFMVSGILTLLYNFASYFLKQVADATYGRFNQCHKKRYWKITTSLIQKDAYTKRNQKETTFKNKQETETHFRVLSYLWTKRE